MGKVKAILYIVGGVLLLIAGFVLRGLLLRRSGSGTAANIQRAGDQQRAALDASERVGDQLDRIDASNERSTEAASDIRSLAERSAELIRRGKEIMASGKHRDSDSSG